MMWRPLQLRFFIRAFVMSALLLIATVPAGALAPGEQLDDPALEARARVLSTELRCVVCQNQSIDDSDAPLAADLRRLVRERLVAGDTDGQVIDFVVARYGEFVLLRPRFGAHTAVLWLLPFALLMATGLWIFLRTRRSAARLPVNTDRRELTAEEEAALAEVLDDTQRTRANS